MEGIIALLVNLAIGAAGGNLAGLTLKAKSLGLLWNSVVGILGGGLGYFLLGLVGAGRGFNDPKLDIRPVLMDVDEIGADPFGEFGPARECLAGAAVDDDGNLIALNMRISGQSILAGRMPQALQDGKTVQVRHHHVQNDCIWLNFACHSQSIIAIRSIQDAATITDQVAFQ